MNCCGTLENFGCYCYCDDDFVTAIQPTISGLHTLEYDFGGHIKRKRFSAVRSGVFELPNIFNEDGKQFFKLKQPNGEYFTLNGAECFFLSVDGCSDFTEEYKECDDLFDCVVIDEAVDCLT